MAYGGDVSFTTEAYKSAMEATKGSMDELTDKSRTGRILTAEKPYTYDEVYQAYKRKWLDRGYGDEDYMPEPPAILYAKVEDLDIAYDEMLKYLDDTDIYGPKKGKTEKDKDMSKTYKRDRKSPPYSATAYDDGTYGVGVDGKVWQIGTVSKTTKRPSGYKRWLSSYHTSSSGKAIRHTPSPEMVGYDDFIERKEKDMSGSDGRDTLYEDDGDTIKETDELEYVLSGDEEDTPEEVVEIEEEPEPIIDDSVMGKIKASVGVPEEFKFTDNQTFYTMLRNIFRGKNILVTGPSGCGKSSLGKILAEITNKPFYSFNFGDTMNPSAKILGDTKFSKEEGTFFKQSRFVGAITDNSGAFIMLDEITRDRTGDLANILMPVLDGQKYLALDESDDAGIVSLDSNAFFYATANIGREYLGCAHDLDRAWKDRFCGGLYELDYLPQKKEQDLIRVRVPQISEDNARRITEFAKKIRDLYKAEELNVAVSTRMSITTAELVVDGMTLLDALKHTVLPFYPLQGGDDTERVRVIQCIQSMGD